MILVTGSTGTVGSEVLKQLMDKGVHPKALVHHQDTVQKASSLGAEAVVGDLNDIESLVRAMEGVDHLFLLSPSGPDQVKREANAVEAAKRAGVSRIVKLSVIGASPTSDINLVRWHWQSEKYIEDSGIGFTHIRPTLFMQNLLRMSGMIVNEDKVYAPAGDGKASLIDARDIASAAVAALTEEGHMGRAYEITGPEALSYYDIADRLSAATGRRIEYVDVTRDEARQAMQDMGFPDWLLDDSLAYYDYTASGEMQIVTHWLGKLIGRQPNMFEAFACDYAGAFRRGYMAA